MNPEKTEILTWFDIVIEVDSITNAQIMLFCDSLGPMGQVVFRRMDEKRKKIMVFLSKSSAKEILAIRQTLGQYSTLFHDFGTLLELFLHCVHDSTEEGNYIPPNIRAIIDEENNKRKTVTILEQTLVLLQDKIATALSEEEKSELVATMKKVEQNIKFIISKEVPAPEISAVHSNDPSDQSANFRQSSQNQ